MATANTDPGAVIENGTPLTRNHWFDGKLLRADDLARDQDYHRTALRLANQAGGFGIVHGLEVTLDSAELVLQPGLGVTPHGELLLLNGELRVGVEALLGAGSAVALRLRDASGAEFQRCVALDGAAEAAPVPAGGLRIYRLSLELNQALCGFEDVVGSLCERACVSERQRPYQLEGVRLRAQVLPLMLAALPGFEPGAKHLRSRVASALFAREDAAIPPLPDDGGRLLSPLWCTGADFATGRTVTLGYLVRQSGSADFVELWSGRRERMQTQAQGYWQRRTRLRPFADFIAQVAQFQCQLTRAFDGAPAPAPAEGGDCDSLRAVVAELKAQIDAEAPVDAPEIAPDAAAPEGNSGLLISHATSPVLMQRLSHFSKIVAPFLLKRVDRLLLDRGIVELPPAGFLPVHGDTALQTQVQNLVGPGVQLRMCTAPLDAIGHLFEEAQHSARTALTPGLADPTNKPLLQVIVPDGTSQDAAVPGIEVGAYAAPGWLLVLWLAATKLAAFDEGDLLRTGAGIPVALLKLIGKKRLAALLDPAQDASLIAQGAGRISSTKPGRLAIAIVGNPDNKESTTGWMEFALADDPFTAAPGSTLSLDFDLADLSSLLPAGGAEGDELHFTGSVGVDPDPNTVLARRAEIEDATGVAGGELCGVSVDGLIRIRAHVHGDPQQADDPGTQISADHKAAAILQRVRESTGMRWLVIKPLPGAGEGRAYLVYDLRAPDINGVRQLVLRRVERETAREPNGVQTVNQTITIARFRTDPQALTVGAPARTQAEASLALLDQHLPDIAPDAAARQRLFGSGGASGGLQGPHDWVLFRRPVDAQCAVPAPLPVVAAPPPPQVIKTTTYRAAVARLLPSASAAVRKQVLDELRQGKLPDASTTRLESAGSVTYSGSALQPDESDVRLVAQFGRAGFAAPCRLVGVFSADARVGALMLDRAKRLGQKLGAEPQDGVVWAQSPQTAQDADGLMVFAVEPDDLPAPPPPQPTPPQPTPPPAPPPSLIRGHTVWLYTNAARDKLGLDGDALFKALATNGQSVLDRMLGVGARQVPFPVQFNWGPGGTGSLSVDGTLLAQLKAQGGWPANLFVEPPTLFSLDATTDSVDDHKRTNEEAQFLMGQAILGSTATLPAPRVRTGTHATPLTLIGGTQVLTVVLVRQ